MGTLVKRPIARYRTISSDFVRLNPISPRMGAISARVLTNFTRARAISVRNRPIFFRLPTVPMSLFSNGGQQMESGAFVVVSYEFAPKSLGGGRKSYAFAAASVAIGRYRAKSFMTVPIKDIEMLHPGAGRRRT